MIMLVFLLALQTAAAPPDDAPPEQLIEPEMAAGIFVDACWNGLQDRTVFRSALRKSSLRFRRTPTQTGFERQRSMQADIWYGNGHCSMTIMVATESDADSYVKGITARLGLRPPSVGWVSDLSNTRGANWRETRVRDYVFRMRGQIEYPNRALNPNGPTKVDIYLGGGRELK